MAKAASAPAKADSAGAKRPKTGGRVKKSIDQMLVETRVRNELAPYDDSTDVPAALAALYLGVSEDTLLELRKPRPKGEQGERGTVGPPFYKVTPPGAVAQNQTVMYPLGGLREYKKKHMGVTSHEVAVKSNMLGWVAAQEPFFAAPEARRQRTLLIAAAWDFDEPERDEMFAQAARGEIRVVWMSPADAACQRWKSSARHRAFAKAWLELLASEAAAVRAAVESTEMSEVALEPKPNKRADQQDRD